LYGCRGLLDEQSYRIAAAQLIARHEGLHAELSDGPAAGMDLIRFMKEIVTLHVTFWPEAQSRIKGLPAWARWPASAVTKYVHRCANWAFKGSWPSSVQMRITQEFLDQRVRVFRCRSWREVDEATNRFRDEFTPPFVMALFLLEPSLPGSRLWDIPVQSDGGAVSSAALPHEWGAPSSFVQFVVSHAYSDGFSVPLIHDFGSLYSEVDAARQGLPPTSTLAALPYGASFDVLQDRFFAAIEGRAKWAYPDLMSLRATCFDGPWAPRRPPWVYNHEVLVELGAVTSLHQSAKRYGVPFDVVLLSLVLAATFRASEGIGQNPSDGRGKNSESSSSSSQVRSLPLTLYAPMRDGDLNDAMVGLFSDWRDSTVACSGSTTLLGLCLDVADTIRHRRWTVFDPIQNSERILVNILPLDEQPRGPSQFRQTRAHEYGNKRSASGRERRAWKQPHRPMRITLEQEAPDAWWLSLDVNASCYPTAWCRGLVRQMRTCIEELAKQPLVPVLGGSSSASHLGGASKQAEV